MSYNLNKMEFQGFQNQKKDSLQTIKLSLEKQSACENRLIAVRVIIGVILSMVCFVIQIQSIKDSKIGQFKLVMLENDYAKCLDGSIGAYYIREGDPKRVLLYLAGGGWCIANSNPQDFLLCQQRSRTALGSSIYHEQKAQLKQKMFSINQSNYFANWTIIKLLYCDGLAHQGQRSKAITYNGTHLYFRGDIITRQQFSSVNKSHGIFTSKVTHLVLCGSSAGGASAFQWSNYIQQRLSVSTNYRLIIESAIFLDQPDINGHYPHRQRFQRVYSVGNEQIPTPSNECNLAYKDEPWKCLLSQYLMPFIKSPIFVIESLYDPWGLKNIMGLNCQKNRDLSKCNLTEMAIINHYRLEMKKFLYSVAENSQNGVWAPACLAHCFLYCQPYQSTLWRVPQRSPNSLGKSIEHWLQGTADNSVFIDQVVWPNNVPCHNAKLR